jgi:hypothetical protein
LTAGSGTTTIDADTQRSATNPRPAEPTCLGPTASRADDDAFGAGRAAAADALRGDDPKLLLLFCSDSYDLPRLLELGCGKGQGFLFARPLPVEALEALPLDHGSLAA